MEPPSSGAMLNTGRFGTNQRTDDAMFIEHRPGDTDPLRPKVPRLHHKKSKTGCQLCRARRIKCDERHPTCGDCQLHRASCVYDRFKPVRISKTPEPGSDVTTNKNSTKNPSTQSLTNEKFNTPEVKEKHLLELRLLHHYSTATSQSLPTAFDPKVAEIWKVSVPHLAFEHVALLDAIFSIAALHLALSSRHPEQQELMNAHRSYMDLCLERHRDDLAHISSQNADVLWFTSSLVRTAAFATLQERPVDPYAPPTQWLEIASGAVPVFLATWDWIKADPKSEAMGIMKETIVFTDKEAFFKESNRRGFVHLLQRMESTRDLTEPWDGDIQEAYETTLSYLGSVKLAIDAGRPRSEIGLRLIGFASMVPKRFISLVGEQRPRALVVLAHFFALLIPYREIWWIGNTGQREVRGIQRILPEEWQDLMEWPLSVSCQ